MSIGDTADTSQPKGYFLLDDNSINISNGTSIIKYLGHASTKRLWSWVSKDLTMGNDTQEKNVKKIISEVKKKGIPVIVVADSVVAGGISASYAAVGDFLFFVGKKTKWMFAGPRVAANVSNTTLPENFLEGEWCMSHGYGDFLIEKRKDTKDFLIKFLNIILKKDQSSIIGEENIDNINQDIISGFTKRCYQIFNDRGETIKSAFGLAKKNDMVVILGKGREEYQEIKGEKLFYSDQKLIREWQ